MRAVPVHETGVLAAQRRAVRYTTATGIQNNVIVPPGVQWDISSITVVLVESAVVGARDILLSIIDPSGNIVYTTSTIATPAALGGQRVYLTLFPGSDSLDTYVVPIQRSLRPILPRLYDGYGIYYSLEGDQAGDTCGMAVSYEEVY
jgi:hypothetical protein